MYLRPQLFTKLKTVSEVPVVPVEIAWEMTGNGKQTGNTTESLLDLITMYWLN